MNFLNCSVNTKQEACCNYCYWLVFLKNQREVLPRFRFRRLYCV